MDTELLKTFLEVQKTRHFGRAAENLFLTQSAVSFRVRQLEGLLGVSLFERQRNNIHLTRAGERLVPYAESILEAWKQAQQEVGQGGEQQLQLALGGTPNIWDAYLQDGLGEIARVFPNLALRAEVLDTAALVRAVLEHTLDLAVVFDLPKTSELAVHRLGDVKLDLVASRPGVSAERAMDEGVVMLDWGSAFNQRQVRMFTRTLTPRLHTGQSRIALDFLLQHGGVAYLPERLVDPFIQTGALHRVAGAEPVVRELFALSLRETQQADTLESVLELLDSLSA